MTYFWQIFNTNLYKIKKIKKFFEEFLKNIPRIFPQKQSPKGVPVAPISPFVPYNWVKTCN